MIDLKAIVEPMHGWCTPEKAQLLFDLVIKSDSKLTVELGVFGGRSLIPMALAHKQKGSGFALGVDTWSPSASLEGVNDKANDDWWETIDYKMIKQYCIDQIASHELFDYCETLHMHSTSVAVLFGNDTIDILHQDSNHSEKITCAEVELYWNKIKPGGYWVSDDTDWKTTQKAQQMLIDKGYQVFAEFNTYKIFRRVA